MSLRAEANPVAGSVLIFQQRGAVEHLIDELSPDEARAFGAFVLGIGQGLIAAKPSLDALSEVSERR